MYAVTTSHAQSRPRKSGRVVTRPLCLLRTTSSVLLEVCSPGMSKTRFFASCIYELYTILRASYTADTPVVNFTPCIPTHDQRTCRAAETHAQVSADNRTVGARWTAGGTTVFQRRLNATVWKVFFDAYCSLGQSSLLMTCRILVEAPDGSAVKPYSTPHHHLLSYQSA